jgi:PhzF family phenazine biosynthesis protein
MAPSEYRFVVVDVFTSTAFTGNQLAIVHLPSEAAPTRDQRHSIAREFNFSETVFLYDTRDGAVATEARKVEIWTPFAELPFAGTSAISFLRDTSRCLRGQRALKKRVRTE